MGDLFLGSIMSSQSMMFRRHVVQHCWVVDLCSAIVVLGFLKVVYSVESRSHRNYPITGVEFVNFRRYDLEVFWDDGGSGVTMGVVAGRGGVLHLGGTSPGHTFNLVRRLGGDSRNLTNVIQTFVMSLGVFHFIVEPEAEDAEMTTLWKKRKAYQEGTTGDGGLVALETLHRRGELRSVSLIHRRPPVGGEADLAMGVRFKNFRRYDLHQFWEDGSSTGVYRGRLEAMTAERTYHTSHVSHGFRYMRERSSGGGGYELVARFVIERGKRDYVVEPDPEDQEAVGHPVYLQHLEESRYSKRYREERGIDWLGKLPPTPPTLPMRTPGKAIGDVAHRVKVRGRLNHDGSRAAEGVYELRSLSAGPPEGPRAFIVEDLLDARECDHVIQMSEHRLNVSMVGLGGEGIVEQSRSSMTVFMDRSESAMLDVIHERFADVLGLTDEEVRGAAELLQVVRYRQGEEYAPHHDYGAAENMQRLLTLLVYLDTPEAGGGTSFPHAFEGRGLYVQPRRGSAILFYNQLPDGNMDELSLHAGAKVEQGVKRACNLWVHSHAGVFSKNLEQPGGSASSSHSEL